MGRNILAVVAGFILANLVIVGVEMVSSLIYRPPPGFNPRDPEAMRELMAVMPAGAWLMVALAWFLGTAVGAAVAVRIGRQAPAALAVVIGSLLLAAGVANMLMLPHPGWFVPAGLAMFPLGAYVGLLIGRRRQSAV
jgi:hypothetical protein